MEEGREDPPCPTRTACANFQASPACAPRLLRSEARLRNAGGQPLQRTALLAPPVQPQPDPREVPGSAAPPPIAQREWHGTDQIAGIAILPPEWGFGPYTDVLGPTLDVLPRRVRIWNLKKETLSSQIRLCTQKCSSAPYSESGSPKNKALCREDDSLGPRTEGVSSKKAALASESRCRALTEGLWP